MNKQRYSTSHSVYTILYIILLHWTAHNNDLMGGVVEAKLIKMCLSGYTPSGHVRSDPIIHQSCPSDHIHTFYGPQNFHPQTSYEDMRDTPSKFSTTPFVENQSLYWHPTIYRVTTNNNGKKTYIRAETTEMTPYYRWDDSKTNTAFPPKFRMIAHSNDDGADRGQLDGEFNLSTECCQYNEDKDEVECDWWTKLHLPRKKCDYLEIVFAMPTCWNGESLGDDNDHKDHMRYTINGRVDGPCPNGYPHRFPQIQVTMSIIEYQGGTYQLSDEQSTVWHVDFFNGWKEDTLQDILDNCEATKPDDDDDDENLDYNPPCSCTPEEGIDDFLTFNENNPRSAVCDVDVLKLIIDEAVDVVSDTLPRGTCQGSNVIPKSWTEVTDDLYQCKKENVCVDTTTTFSANKRKRSCSWVEKKATTARCAKSGIAIHCPKTCGTCKEHACVNVPKRFYLDNGNLKSCKWVSKKKKNRCKLDGVALNCRKSCSNPMCNAAS